MDLSEWFELLGQLRTSATQLLGRSKLAPGQYLRFWKEIWRDRVGSGSLRVTVDRTRGAGPGPA